VKSGIQFLDFPSESSNSRRGAFHTGVELIEPQATYDEQGFIVADEGMSNTPIYQKDRGLFHTGVEGI
jgi:hypothetical protein